MATPPPRVRSFHSSHPREDEHRSRHLEQDARGSEVRRTLWTHPHNPQHYRNFIAPANTVLDDWKDDYRHDPEVFTYFFNPTTRELKDDKRRHFKYGRLWADDKIVVPKNRIQEVISAHHDPIVAGHWGVHRTLSMIQRRFYFPRMRKLVSDHIASCDV